MAGTKAGAQKTRETNLRKYGPNYYKEIGARGGSISHPETRPFYVDRHLASRASEKALKRKAEYASQRTE